MIAKEDWFEDEAFWEWTEPVLFCSQRLQSTPQQTDRILDLIEIAPDVAVLDLCCGPGRHSLELARRGFAVTGVDRTARYLERARSAAAAEDLAVEFVQDDMRRFLRPSSFAAVLNLYTSFGYFRDPADDRRVLENIRASLQPGGILLMEMLGKEILARTFRERDWVEYDDGLKLLEDRTLDPDWSHVTSRWLILRGDAQREFTMHLRLYSGIELLTLLQSCGFADVRMFGSLAGGPYDQTAQRLVARARRP